MINEILSFLENIFGNYYLLLVINSVFFFLKIILFFFVLKKILRQKKSSHLSYILAVILFSAALTDTAWIVKLISLTFVPTLDYRIVIFWIRIAWIFFIVEYQCLALFIEKLISRDKNLSLRQIICSIPSMFFVLFFLSLALININCRSQLERPAIDPLMQQIASAYLVLILMPLGIYYSLRYLKSHKLPIVLKKQYKALIEFLILPHLLSDFIHLNPLKTQNFTDITQCYTVVGISTIILTCSLYFCARRIMGLRFLNFTDEIQSPSNHTAFDAHFRETLMSLGTVIHQNELTAIVQTFFKEVFAILPNKVSMYIPQTTPTEPIVTDQDEEDIDDDQEIVPTPHTPRIKGLPADLISFEDQLMTHLNTHRILIYDEIDFNNFYEQDELQTTMLQFLENINADIFLPIFDNERLVGQIIIARHARYDTLYTSSDRNAMIVFANYLGAVITMLQHKNFEQLIEQCKRLEEQLHYKVQQIQHCKESIRSFLRNSAHKEVGVIFYKNRSFIPGNQASTELIEIDLNKQEGHQTTRIFKQLVQSAEEYKKTQTSSIKTMNGTPLVLTAIPYLGQRHVIIIITPPDISDVIKKQMELLHNMDEWDYLLYLQTTHAGQLINQFIPGSSPVLLNHKIELLKASMSKKATIIDVSTGDAQPIAHLMHHISMRKELHLFEISEMNNHLDIEVQLFGINPAYGINKQVRQPLLSALHGGTLCINNIQFMHGDTQNALANYIQCGYFKSLKSDTRIESDVRIIATNTIDIQHAIKHGSWNQDLYNQFKDTHVCLPSLLTLSDTDLIELAEGYRQQAFKNNNFAQIFTLSENDKHKLLLNRPASFTEIKDRILSILINKSKNSNIETNTLFDPGYNIDNPKLIQAARLGKNALKDPQMLSLLWYKFNKSQNKIATFLGVNRSSVSRRIKEHNLT
jgi:transcriptional regulator with PAS, ATPase and Fis domain